MASLSTRIGQAQAVPVELADLHVGDARQVGPDAQHALRSTRPAMPTPTDRPGPASAEARARRRPWRRAPAARRRRHPGLVDDHRRVVGVDGDTEDLGAPDVDARDQVSPPGGGVSAQ